MNVGACQAPDIHPVLHSRLMQLRTATFFGFYFWFSVPGGREATV